MTLNPSTLEYLTELRRRLLIFAFGFLAIFLCLFYFSRTLFQWLALPLLHQLPPSHHLIATQITASLTVPLEFTFYLTLVLTMPLLIHQCWAFVAPALYKKEQRFLWPLLFSSILLFYLGIAFAYFLVFPFIFKFFISFAPIGVALLPDIKEYLTFAEHMLFIFGLSFEIPVVIFVVIYWELISHETLQKARPYMVILAFTLGMLLTPPDVLSQVLLAIPLWILFEIGLAAGYLAKKKNHGVLVETR